MPVERTVLGAIVLAGDGQPFRGLTRRVVLYESQAAAQAIADRFSGMPCLGDLGRLTVAPATLQILSIEGDGD